MGFKIEPTREGDHLLCRPAGETSVGAMIELAESLRDALAREGLRCALIDCSAMAGGLNLIELYEVGERFSEILPRGARLAGINMPERWRDNDFSENVIRNRGGALRHFVSAEAARAWFAEP